MRPFRLLPVALVVFALGCAETETSEGEMETEATAEAEAMAATADQVPGAVAADPDHYSVAFENDAVRLLRVSYGPGESSVMHDHPAHCAVALSGTIWRMTSPEGETSDLDVEAGDVLCVPAGAHRPQNAGDAVGSVVVVEFKEGATAGADALPEHPDAVTADPEHYTVEFENDVARLIRIAYDAGETSVMHRHPAGCAIFLHDQPTRMELPDGEVVEHEPAEAGHVECGDAEAHLPTNAGDGSLELILVELKGRAAAGG